jgi:hypothetical protein
MKQVGPLIIALGPINLQILIIPFQLTNSILQLKQLHLIFFGQFRVIDAILRIESIEVLAEFFVLFT